MLRSSRTYTSAPSLNIYRSRPSHRPPGATSPCPRRRFNILAIESSCDDSCVAVLDIKPGTTDVPIAKLLFSEKKTSNSVEYGGIHPLRALEGHHTNVAKLVKLAMARTGLTGVAREDGEKVDLIAVTKGPGMRNNLQAGIDVAKGLSVAWRVPMLGVHHMHAHALTSRMEFTLGSSALGSLPGSSVPHVKPSFPFLSLLVSGGHTLLVSSKSITEHQILASTVDIAVGDCLDKIARLILPRAVINASTHVSYGSLLEAFAFGQEGVPNRGGIPQPKYDYTPPANKQEEVLKATAPSSYGWYIPSPYFKNGSQNMRASDFSFSGIVSHVERIVRQRPPEQPIPIDEARALAKAAMETVFEHLTHRVRLHVESLRENPLDNTGQLAQQDSDMIVVLAGGVAANRYLRHILKSNLSFHFYGQVRLCQVPMGLCTDNAAMIAWAAAEMVGAVETKDKKFKLEFDDYKQNLEMRALRKWSLENLMTPEIEEEREARDEKRRDERQAKKKETVIDDGSVAHVDSGAAEESMPHEVENSRHVRRIISSSTSHEQTTEQNSSWSPEVLNTEIRRAGQSQSVQHFDFSSGSSVDNIKRDFENATGEVLATQDQPRLANWKPTLHEPEGEFEASTGAGGDLNATMMAGDSFADNRNLQDTTETHVQVTIRDDARDRVADAEKAQNEVDISKVGDVVNPFSGLLGGTASWPKSRELPSERLSTAIAERQVVALEGINATLKGLAAILADSEKMADMLKGIARALDSDDGKILPVKQDTIEEKASTAYMKSSVISSPQSSPQQKNLDLMFGSKGLLSRSQQWSRQEFDETTLSSKSTDELRTMLSTLRDRQAVVNRQFSDLERKRYQERKAVDPGRKSRNPSWIKAHEPSSTREAIAKLHGEIWASKKNEVILVELLARREGTFGQNYESGSDTTAITPPEEPVALSQPVVEVDDGTTHTAQALARWRRRKLPFLGLTALADIPTNELHALRQNFSIAIRRANLRLDPGFWRSDSRNKRLGIQSDPQLRDNNAPRDCDLELQVMQGWSEQSMRHNLDRLTAITNEIADRDPEFAYAQVAMDAVTDSDFRMQFELALNRRTATKTICSQLTTQLHPYLADPGRPAGQDIALREKLAEIGAQLDIQNEVVWKYELALIERKYAFTDAYGKSTTEQTSVTEAMGNAGSWQTSRSNIKETSSSQAGTEAQRDPAHDMKHRFGKGFDRISAIRETILTESKKRDIAAEDDTLSASHGMTDGFPSEPMSTEPREDGMVTVNMSELAQGAPFSSSTDLENVLAVLQEQQTSVRSSSEAAQASQFSARPASHRSAPVIARQRVSRLRSANSKKSDVRRSSHPRDHAWQVYRSRARARLLRIRGHGIVQPGGQAGLLQVATPKAVKSASAITYGTAAEMQIGSINEI